MARALLTTAGPQQLPSVYEEAAALLGQAAEAACVLESWREAAELYRDLAYLHNRAGRAEERNAAAAACLAAGDRAAVVGA
jgi:hypothetical protein